MSSPTAAPAAAASPTKPAKTPEQIAYSKYIGPRTEAHVRNLGIILAAVTAAFAVWHGLTLLEERYERRRLERGTASRTPALLRGKRALSAATRKYFTYLTLSLPPLFTITPTELLLFTLYLLTTLLLTLTEAPRAPAKAPGAKRNYGWSSRAGWITLATYPWLVALGMKHNPISYLTGASYERLQKLHRLCSRGTLLIMLMHVAAKVWLKNTFDEGWRAWGLAGTIFGCLIFVLGNKWVFRAAYQFFVYSHVLLVAWLFVATWYHVVDLDGTNEDFKPYLISSIILWLLDRALRLFNVLWINGLIPLLAKKKPATSSTPASVTVYNDRLMRLEVPQPASMPRWEPGAHVYLMAPPKKGGVSLIYESHPFTIANLSAREGGGAGSHQRAGDATTVATLQQHPSAGSSAASPSSTPMTEKDSASAHNEKSHATNASSTSPTMSFLIRPQRGFTGRLFSHAKRGADIDVRVATAPLSAPRLRDAVAGFDTMVLCAAGVGVSWTVPLLLDAVRRPASATVEGKGKGGLRRIVFLWTVQQRSELAVIREEIAEALRLAAASQGGLQVEVRVHVTREQVTHEDLPAEWRSAAGSDEKASSSKALASIHTYRPDVHALLSSVVNEAQGRVWVGVCGPYEFGCDVKGAARKCIRPMEVLTGGEGDGRGDVVVHAEVFGW